jgi:hypothetical protein
LLGTEARQLRAAIATAPDHALVKVISVLDRNPNRNLVSELLDAARPRLRRLRPPRPLSFDRLLFLPLDGAIVDAREWRGEEWRIPRTALPPISRAIRDAMSRAAGKIPQGWSVAEIERLMDGRSFSDLDAVSQAGMPLWQAASTVASGVRLPPDWGSAGLKETQFERMLALAASVWRHAAPIWDALGQAASGPSETVIRSAFVAVAAEGVSASRAVAATLMLKAAKPGRVAGVAAGLHGMPTDIAYGALDDWLAACRPNVPENDPAAAVHMAEAFLEALDDLEQSKLVGTPERRAKVAALRRKTAELCRKAYETRAREDLVAPLAAPMSGDEVILALEAKARHLRALEQAGRRLADPEMFDRMRVELMETIRRAKHGVDVSGAGLEDVDLIRLIEILSGPEAAILLRPKL